jgi:hypothetical protein
MPWAKARGLMRVVLADYVAGRTGLELRARFASWAAVAGFVYATRGGIAVALDERGRVAAALDITARRVRPPGLQERRVARSVPRVHTHGFAQSDGTWRCIQDYYVGGDTPGTGCGQLWKEADED